MIDGKSTHIPNETLILEPIVPVGRHAANEDLDPLEAIGAVADVVAAHNSDPKNEDAKNTLDILAAHALPYGWDSRYGEHINSMAAAAKEFNDKGDRNTTINDGIGVKVGSERMAHQAAVAAGKAESLGGGSVVSNARMSREGSEEVDNLIGGGILDRLRRAARTSDADSGETVKVSSVVGEPSQALPAAATPVTEAIPSSRPAERPATLEDLQGSTPIDLTRRPAAVSEETRVIPASTIAAALGSRALPRRIASGAEQPPIVITPEPGAVYIDIAPTSPVVTPESPAATADMTQPRVPAFTGETTQQIAPLAEQATQVIARPVDWPTMNTKRSVGEATVMYTTGGMESTRVIPVPGADEVAQVIPGQK